MLKVKLKKPLKKSNDSTKALKFYELEDENKKLRDENEKLRDKNKELKYKIKKFMDEIKRQVDTSKASCKTVNTDKKTMKAMDNDSINKQIIEDTKSHIDKDTKPNIEINEKTLLKVFSAVRYDNKDDDDDKAIPKTKDKDKK